MNMKKINETVFEQYEFKGWLITIQNYMGMDELIGFAVPTKYAHLLNVDNYYWFSEIAEENGIEIKIDEYGDEYYEDFIYIVFEPDDNFNRLIIDGNGAKEIKKINNKNSSHILEHMVNEIITQLDIDHPDTIVLKQVYKKSIAPKVGKRKTGFLHQAWASMVKERDKKCIECGSVYDLHSHHIKQYKSHPELRYDVNNGITLCGNCHRKWHSENGR
jgi:hypothetical protein